MARFYWTKLKEQTYPEFEDIRKALDLADKPDSGQRDVRQLKALEMRMVESAPRLRGHILTRRTALTSYDYALAPEDPADVEHAAEALDRIRPALHALLSAHTQIPMFGEMALRLKPVPTAGDGFGLALDRRYLPTELERGGEDLQRVAILEVEAGKITGRTFPDEDVENYWITGVDDDTVAQGGILRSLVYHEKIRHLTVQEWANYNEKVKGIVYAMWKEHAGDEDKKTAKSAVQGLMSGKGAVTSDAVTYGFEQTVSYIGATSFKDFKAALEADIAVAILGQANTTELPKGGGSRAALQVLQLIRADIHFSDILRMTRELAPQLLLADYRLNIDKAATSVPWSLRLSLSDDSDVEKEVRAAVDAIEGGIPLKRDEVYSRIGYTMPGDDDDVIENRVGVLPPPPEGGPDG